MKTKEDKKGIFKMRTLINSQPALAELMSKSLPIGIAWNLTRFVKKLDIEAQAYHEIRNKKIIELGEPKKDASGNDTGEHHIVNPEAFKKFKVIENELLEKEVKLEPFTIKSQELLNHKDSKGNKIDISAIVLMDLDWLIVE